VAHLSEQRPVPGSKGDSTPAATLIPIAAAIGIFGAVYGAAAQPLLGTWLTIASSVVIFSGTVQFTMVSLLAAGTGPLAILWAVFVVNVRNFALGGAVRPFLVEGRLRRVITSWFLIDETVGLALASPAAADRILLRSGLAAYSAWVAGTVVGVAGGAAFGLEALAGSVFPVLFIGLAALMITGAGALARAVAGAGITLGLLVLWPGVAGLAPVLGGLVAAMPGGRNRG
jgi:predicted branched-subunit amino acid permease